MEKKIEKLEGSYDVPQLKQKLNEIIDYLNTQPQARAFTEFTDKNISDDIPKDFVDIDGKLHKFEYNPEQKEEWEEEFNSWFKERFGEDYENTYFKGDLYDLVKNLLLEREREVLETIKELVDGKSIYSNNGCGTPLELIEWFVDTELDKLNKKK